MLCCEMVVILVFAMFVGVARMGFVWILDFVVLLVFWVAVGVVVVVVGFIQLRVGFY